MVMNIHFALCMVAINLTDTPVCDAWRPICYFRCFLPCINGSRRCRRSLIHGVSHCSSGLRKLPVLAFSRKNISLCWLKMIVAL